MLTDYADKQYGVNFRANMKYSIKRQALEYKRLEELYESTYLMFKQYFIDSMRKIKNERLGLTQKLIAEAE